VGRLVGVQERRHNLIIGRFVTCRPKPELRALFAVFVALAVISGTLAVGASPVWAQEQPSSEPAPQQSEPAPQQSEPAPQQSEPAPQQSEPAPQQSEPASP
jgi:hypothetical protein